MGEIGTVAGVGITPMRSLPKPATEDETPPKPSEPSTEDGVRDSSQTTRRSLERAWEVKNTFIHYESPLKKISVSTPPKTVPSSFAPELQLGDGGQHVRGAHPLEHTPAEKQFTALNPLATPSTNGGGAG